MGKKCRFYVDIMAMHEEVTGSCNLAIVKFPNGETLRFVTDCGLFQERKYDELNNELPFDPEKVDFCLITHTHVDHIGSIVEMNELTKKDLALILKKSELSIFKRYQNELSNMGITLIYNDDLFESIAEKSLVLDTGARELSNTVNYMFENIVFDVLSNPNKYKKCILDSEIAQDNTKYTLS